MRKGTIEEDKAVVTPDMKKDPVSTAAQPSNDLAKSETLPDSNVENSESQPSKDLSNSESNPNKELPSDTLATSGDTGTLPNHELDNSKEPVDSESQPSKDLSNSESKPDKELPSDTLATSGDTGTLPNHELDNSKEPVHSESQPSKDLSNSESKPDKELPSDTLATSGDTETLPNHELDNSQEPPNDHPENSESSGNAEASQNIKSVNFDIPPSSNAPSDQKASEPSYRLLNSEALPNNNAGNSEIQTNNEMLVSETQCSNEVVMSETRQSNDVVVSETQQSKEVVVSETPQSNDVVVSETQQSNEVAVSETQQSNEEAVSVTRQSNEVAVSETRLSNEVVVSETQQNNEVAVSETRQSKEVAMSETQQRNEVVTKPSNEVVMPETQPSNEANMPETQTCDNAVTQPSNEVVEPETQQSNEVVMQPSNEMVISDTQPSNETNMLETQTCDDMVMQRSNEVVEPETQQSYEVVTQRSNKVVEPETQQIYEMATQPSNEVVMSDTQLGNEANMPETQTCDDVVMSEAIPENELGNPITDPNNQLCHSEMLHDNQFANFHMIPEDQLPQPESLPHSEPPPNSEPLADNHLTDIKPVPHNHLAHYETVPNNHLNHSEAFSNNHLANSESLSHDQLANSQILTHYELENNEAMHNNQLVNSQAHYELAISNALPSYEIINAETPLNNEERTPETQPSKRRKKKSIVWEHFTIDTISPGCRRARCNQCDQTFAYSTGSKVAGTSHLKRHIAKGTCSAILRSQEHNQLNPYTPRTRGSGAGNASDPPKRRYRSPSTPYIIFDQDHCRHEIARMIIMHDYPLHMVEHPGFVAFVQNLQPQFKMVTFNTIQGDCVATYLVEKGNLMKYFEGLPGRVCLTLDIWSSSQSLGYVFITGHFVDNDWKLQRRILNVVMEPYPDSDSALSHAVAVCLSDWGLEGRLFSVTCNRSMNEVALENLRPLLSVKNTLILNGQFLVGNCIARTLSSVAKDLLGSAQDLINKIRDSVKYVKTSESHEEKFLELKQQLQVPSERSLFIDDQIQWNTTYQMLIAASELKEVFSCLDTSDPDYKGAPSMQDWKLVETLCAYLKPLFDAANILTTATHPTAITFFHEVWKLQLDVGRAVMSEDPFISNLNKIMHEKIDKYWRDCSLVLALAVVMDPRFKMKLVEFSFTKIHGEDAHMYIKIVDDGIHELFHEYVTLPLPLTPAYAEDGSAGRHSKMHESQGGTLLSDNGLTDFDAYIMETTNQQMKSELDQYLEESLLPRVPDFDVLGWWKLNKVKYPTLSKMARDILTVPVSTVPPDSVFYTKSKEMDHYRCSLRPETVEALVCAKDWMQYGAAEASNALVKMVF